MIKKDNYTFAGPKDKVYIVNSDDPHLENRSVRDIAQERGIDEDDCMLDLLGDEKNYVFWLNAPAANVPSNFIDHCESIVKNPYVSVGSDTIMGDPRILTIGTRSDAGAGSPSSPRCMWARAFPMKRLSAEIPAWWPITSASISVAAWWKAITPTSP